jgi:hypothetical protein
MDRRAFYLSLAAYLLAAALGLGGWWLVSRKPASAARRAQEHILKALPDLQLDPPIIIARDPSPPAAPPFAARGLLFPATKGFKINALRDPIEIQCAAFEAYLYYPALYPYQDGTELIGSRAAWQAIINFRLLTTPELDQMPPENLQPYLKAFGSRVALANGKVYVIAGKESVLVEKSGDLSGWLWPAGLGEPGIRFDGSLTGTASPESVLRFLAEIQLDPQPPETPAPSPGEAAATISR